MSKAKALRLQAYYAKQRDALLAAIKLSTPSTEFVDVVVPKRMKLDETPNSVLRGFDVYYNGARQTTCFYADIEAGLIQKWPEGRGGLADQRKPPETFFGNVQIVPKGSKP